MPQGKVVRPVGTRMRIAAPANRAFMFVPLLILLGLTVVAVAILWERRGSDLVMTRFQTVQEARSKGAFKRGWLPPILPDSARDIVETNNLHTNTSEGSFTFNASDYESLVSRLSPARPEAIDHDWMAQASKGFSFFTHSTDAAIWTLALHPE